MRGWEEKTRWQKEVDEVEKAYLPCSPSPHLGPRPPSALVVALPFSLPIPLPPSLPYPPFSRCPSAGSRRDTGPDPYPSCPESAGSAPSGPGGQAEARTPEVHPLPQVGMEPSPPSGWGGRVCLSLRALAPLPSADPQCWDIGRAGRSTHHFLCGERTERPTRVLLGPHASPTAQQAMLGGSGEP